MTKLSPAADQTIVSADLNLRRGLLAKTPSMPLKWIFWATHTIKDNQEIRQIAYKILLLIFIKRNEESYGKDWREV